MSARKINLFYRLFAISFFYLLSQNLYAYSPADLARDLGFIQSEENACGGYYLESALTFPLTVDKTKSIAITGNHALLATKGRSILEGKVSATRDGQQMTANKAFLYRDQDTGKWKTMEMIGNVHLREPNALIISKEARYDFLTKKKSLFNLIYRTSLGNTQKIEEKQHKIKGLTAWGQAYRFSQAKIGVYELEGSSYSTCPPLAPTWQVKASHIVLNKNSGRGYATNARLYVKGLPVFYTPYINFPIDKRRKSGFLWPSFGGSNEWGPYVLAPFYFNLALDDLQ